MRIGYCPDFELLGSPDINCIVDVHVSWSMGTPYLVIDDVLDFTGKVSLFRTGHNEKFWSVFAAVVADMAEDDARLLERAVEMDLEAA